MDTPISFKQFFLCLCAASLIGCGGGGSDSGQDTNTNTGIETITIDNITGFRPEYNEGEEVSLTLNAQGEGADSLIYDWTVTFRGEAYPFTGQDTSSISFTAPEVSGTELVRVNVDIELSGGRLLGNTNQFTTIPVIDRDRLSGITRTNINIQESTTLPSVDSLDTSLIAQGTTWLLNSFVRLDASELEIDGEVFTALSQITYFDLLPSGEVGHRRCGREEVQDFAGESLLGYLLLCPTTAAVNYYQSSDSFRIEVVCDDELSHVSEFTKLSDDTEGNYAEIDLEFSSYPQLTTGANSCGSYAESIVTSYEDEDSDGNPDNTQVGAAQAEFFGTYEGEPIAITVKLDDADSFGQHFLDSFFNRDGFNSIAFVSPVLAKLNGQPAEDGSISKVVGEDEVDIEIDAEIVDTDGNTETVSGSFQLKF